MYSHLALLLLTVAMTQVVHGYPENAPTDTVPAICTTMTPVHGTSTGQTTVAPYEIIASDDCYSEGATLKVRLRVADADMEDSYFKGFFVLARAQGAMDASHGTFDAMGTSYMVERSCFGTDDNGISHEGARHFLARTFEWTAPDTQQGDITFMATIVKTEHEFWTAQPLLTLRYDASCTATGTLADEDFDDIDPNEPCIESASHAVGSQEVCAGCSISAQTSLIFALVAMVYKMVAV